MTVFEIVGLIFGLIVLAGITVYLVVNEKKRVFEWLKYAVLQAEKELGNGTGQLKLRLVFDWFCERFPILATIIPFQIFSKWVDIALEIMRKWLSTNSKIEVYVKNGDSV